MSKIVVRPTFNSRNGGWLPHDKKHINSFLNKLRLARRAKPESILTPCVQEFKDFIEAEGTIYAACNMMIDQANTLYADCDVEGLEHLKDYHEMCDLIDEAIQEPPPYNDTGLVAFPINAILDYTMSTPAGYAFYASERVNSHLGAIVRYWGAYLCRPESLIAFKPESEGGGGWSSPEALSKIDMSQFEQPNPEVPGWGYKSWNDWFIRKFVEDERPIADLTDPRVIVNACESTPFALHHDVQLRSQFWLKGQPYSLSFMLGGEEIAKPFVGGDVYQAFLSAFNYHRWHSPITGTITHAEVLPGTYYATNPSVGLDTAGPDLSQGYIANIAARAVFKIKADDPNIGEMALVAIGMSEVSSNIITVSVNQHVTKGDELGYFQFGGSTHCLIFKKGVIESWSPDATADPASVIKLGVAIATVAESEKDC